ncbi:MAG: D-alanyl-D-alanine carboxypeptidase, partial [Proteobacteria bacterium]|nr:D-alanyl-D-alanine carboxypeptidase [Pseudomonadota bacterium]
SIVIDADSGAVLHEVNADTPNYPASLAKMMTLYMVFEALEDGDLRLDQRITVSRRAARQPSSKLGLRRGDKISVEDIILSLVTKSANDAAAAIAETLGGTERNFAKMMTQRARSLGMSNTTFRNASGLPHRRQMTTARDLATLARALRNDFPEYYDFFSTARFSYKGLTHRNHNKLLARYDAVDGIKTGYIHASGFNLATSVKRDGRRLIGVVMGGRSPRSRDRHMIDLLERAFTRITNGNDLFPERAAAKRARKWRATRWIRWRRKSPIRVIPPLKPAMETAAAKTAADTATKAAVRAPAKAKPKNAWAIQVGVFSRFAPAHLAVTRAAGRAFGILRKARVAIIPVKQDGAIRYQARLTGLSEQRAKHACRVLAGKKIDCVTVSPLGEVDVALATQ